MPSLYVERHVSKVTAVAFAPSTVTDWKSVEMSAISVTPPAARSRLIWTSLEYQSEVAVARIAVGSPLLNALACASFALVIASFTACSSALFAATPVVAVGVGAPATWRTSPPRSAPEHAARRNVRTIAVRAFVRDRRMVDTSDIRQRFFRAAKKQVRGR